MNNETTKILKQIDIEDFIWGIYIIIIILSFYTNYLQRDSIINKNKQSREIYKDLEILVFFILIIIYTYFLFKNYHELVGAKKKQKKAKEEFFIASLLLFISGFLFLHASIKYRNIDEETPFY